MKYLIFNAVVIAALVYLFAGDRPDRTAALAKSAQAVTANAEDVFTPPPVEKAPAPQARADNRVAAQEPKPQPQPQPKPQPQMEPLAKPKTIDPV
ncbi:MAG: hypothetical protein ACPGNT_08280, partial [Rhodospirillales bacterium]